MAVISHCGVDYTAPTVEVQSDASATSLEATKVPTGQTITSYLNSKIVVKKGKTPSTTTTTLVVSDTSLYGHYMILGYTIQLSSNWNFYQWVYNNVVSEIIIDSAGIKVKMGLDTIGNNDIWFALLRI